MRLPRSVTGGVEEEEEEEEETGSVPRVVELTLSREARACGKVLFGEPFRL